MRTPPPGTEDGDGSPLTHALPAPSTATHGPTGAHETPFSDWPASFTVALQCGLGLVGLEVLNPAPSWLTATHSDSEAHETALSVSPPGIAEEDHVSGAAACALAVASDTANAATDSPLNGPLMCCWLGRVDELDEHVQEALGLVELGEVA